MKSLEDIRHLERIYPICDKETLPYLKLSYSSN